MVDVDAESSNVSLTTRPLLVTDPSSQPCGMLDTVPSPRIVQVMTALAVVPLAWVLAAVALKSPPAVVQLVLVMRWFHVAWASFQAAVSRWAAWLRLEDGGVASFIFKSEVL